MAVPGALVWAAAYLWYAAQVGVHPDFLGEWLPGQVLSGIGVGATLPVVASGGLMTVPALRYATASAVNATARQVGGVLGRLGWRCWSTRRRRSSSGPKPTTTWSS